MKKVLAFALVALTVASAQALTINWNLTVSGPSLSVGEDCYGVFAVAGAITDLSDYTFASASDYTWLTVTKATETAADVQIFALAANGNNYGTLDSPLDISVTTNFADDVDAITFVVFNNLWYNNNGNGYSLLTVTGVSDLADGATVNLADYGATTLSWTGSTILAQQTILVPEPTALALLALGVAAIALKRKVVA